MEYLFTFIVSFLSALVSVLWLVPKVRAFAVQIGALQEGKGRRIHKGMMPNIGGLAILGGFLIALMLGSLVQPHLLDVFRVELLAIVVGATFMALVGFIDDLWTMSAGARLAAQCLAAGILVVNGVTIDFITDYFGNSGYVFFGETLSVVVTLVWIVGFTNAFNFIDGLDGLSSGIAAISSLCLIAVAVQFTGRGAAVLLLSALSGASLGFLRHNFNPAKIIMGDSGAYMLGYVLSAASVLGALKLTAAVTVVAPMLILALPVLNITQVTLRRLSQGVSPAEARNDHLHDIIRVKSGSKRFTVIVLWLITLSLGGLGMVLSSTPPPLVTGTMVGSSLLLASVSLMRLREADQDSLLD
ncbi:MAG: MraY family glycosyltransferase [Deinococcota bacterium]